MPFAKQKNLKKIVSTKEKVLVKSHKKISSQKKLVQKIVIKKSRKPRVVKRQIPVLIEDTQITKRLVVRVKKTNNLKRLINQLKYLKLISSFWKICTRPLLTMMNIFLIIILVFFSYNSLEITLAFFNDEESSVNNFIGATDLYISTDLVSSDGFRTQTQGAWGARARGNNAAVYLGKNFDSTFPKGITIGHNDAWTAYFASSTDITAFLPSAGEAGSFAQNHLNPIDTEAGILAGQTLSLALNIGFDDYDPNFSINESKLKDYMANSSDSVCQAMTTIEVLNEANKILAGLDSEYAPADINDCLSEINEKFDDGLRQKISPTNFVSREIIVNKEGNLNFQHSLSIEQVSGDDNLCQALDLRAYLGDDLVYSGTLLDFYYAPVVFSNVANKWTLDIGLSIEAGPELHEKNCQLKYQVRAWQENIVSASGGFNDVQDIFDSLDSGTWGPIVVNELFLAPVKDNKNTTAQWLELYNLGTEEYDLSSWYFEDSKRNVLEISEKNTASRSTAISAKGWLLVYLSQDFGAEGEKIVLRDKNKNIIDYYTYVVNNDCLVDDSVDSLKISEKNLTFCSQSTQLKSLARMPDGEGDWLEIIPTPGLENTSLSVVPDEPIMMEQLLVQDLTDISPSESNLEVLSPPVELELGPESIEEVKPIAEENLGVIVSDLEAIIEPEVLMPSEEVGETPVIKEIVPEFVPEFLPAAKVDILVTPEEIVVNNLE